MIEIVNHYIIPAALSVLPLEMASNEAHAMLLAIGLQESRFLEREQRRGPARGFWQFEESGVRGVLEHPAVDFAIAKAMKQLRFDHTLDADVVHHALAMNDILACCFARCLLWTHHDQMPGPAEATQGWEIYTDTWRPGKPRRDSWNALYEEAWTRTLGGRQPPATLKA